MHAQITFSPVAKGLFVAAAFVIIVAGMKAAEDLVVPFLLAMFIAIISTPPLFWLKAKGAPSWLASLSTILGIILVCLILAKLIGTSLNDFSRTLPVYQQKLQQLSLTIIAELDRYGLAIPEQDWVKYFNPSSAFNLVAVLLNSFGNLLSNLLLILLTVVLMLAEATEFPAKLKSMLSDPDRTFPRFQSVADNVKRYLAIKTLTSAATGVVVTLWLAFLGIDFPVLWGMMAFFLNFVPNIGSIIAAIPPVALALVQPGGSTALWVAGGYLLVNNVIGNFVEPRFLGKGLGLSTLVVFVSLVFWGWVLGPVGMFLSVPLTITVKIVVESNESTRWLGLLLGNRKPEKA